MPYKLLQKLGQFVRLSAEDRQSIKTLVNGNHRVEHGTDIIHEGDNPERVKLILTGWACRYKQLEDGRRQIISFLIPGDLCDPHVFVLREMDHSIGALTTVTYTEMSRSNLEDLTAQNPRITQALWWETLVSASIQREWTVNIGQRSAYERLAHLLCELFIRLRVVGLTEGDSCLMPATQAEMADAMGLSCVHINRTLQELRSQGLIVLKGKRLRIPDLDALMQAGLFRPNYLHLDRVGRYLDANISEAYPAQV